MTLLSSVSVHFLAIEFNVLFFSLYTFPCSVLYLNIAVTVLYRERNIFQVLL